MLIQFAVPGVMELLVLLLVAIVLFGIPVVLVLVFGTMWLRSSGDEDVQEQLEALQTEVSQLRAELEDSEATGDEEN